MSEPTWRVLKWPVPLDDAWHHIAVDPGQVKACAAGRDPGHGGYGDPTVFFWADERPRHKPDGYDGRDTSAAWFRVFGTGHPIPPRAFHVATCQDGVFVWHLIATFWNPDDER